jgi:hypothetical protein
MNMVRSAFPLIFLRENLEVVKRAIARVRVQGDRLLRTLGIKTNDLNLIRVDAKRAQVSS